MLTTLALAICRHSPTVEDVRRQAEALIEAKVAPGVVVIVRKNGRDVLRYAGGYADLEQRARMRFDTPHELASVSKQFTAVAALRLVEEGKLDLDDPIAKHIEDAPEAWSKILVRHLLTHQSGLADYLDPTLDLKSEISTKELVDRLKAKKPAFEPGAKWEYSNSGYMVLGYVIEKAGGTPFVDQALASVCRPAGMRSATGASPRETIAGRARGYDRTSDGFVNEGHVSHNLSRIGDGWLMASAEDLLAWHQSLVRGRVLRAETWALAFAPVATGKSEMPNYGFGIGIDRPGPRPRLVHSGGWIGTTTFLMSDLETDACVIILANVSGARIGKLVKGAMDLATAP